MSKPNGTPPVRDGRVVNIADETSDDDGSAILLSGDLPPVARSRSRSPGPGGAGAVEELLPPHCQSLACLARTMLMTLIEQCGNDRACWNSAIGRIKGEEKLGG
jgi:hypothetical protein